MLQNIIFDLGGVLLDLDYQKTVETFTNIGFDDFDEMFSQYKINDLFQQLETGKITENEFYDNLKQISKHPVSDEQLKNAWNSMFTGFRIKSLDFLIALRKQYNLYLLSNTNIIHFKAFSKMLHTQTPYTSMNSFFTKTYYSHEIKLRKPDIEVFEFVLKDAKIHAAETLFIDDSFQNLPNAEKTGIRTHLLLPDERIENFEYSSF